jgi:membrane protein
MKRIRFKQYHNLSLYKFLRIFIHNIEEDEILDRANGVAFNFILAIFPFVIFLFTLIPYVTAYFPEVNKQSILTFLGQMMPPSMFDVVSGTIVDIVSNQRGGLLTFGFVFALFLATNGMLALMRAFNACYRTSDARNIWKMRLTATGLTLLLSVVLFVAIILLVVGQLIINYIMTNAAEFSHFNLDSITIYSLLLMRFIVIFVVFFITISFIYYFGPAVHYNWRFFSIGSLLATLACLAISYGFSYYVTHFGSYNKVYGSIGALIALMVWIQLLTTVLLFGYEINASLHYGSKEQALRANRAKQVTKSFR